MDKVKVYYKKLSVPAFCYTDEKTKKLLYIDEKTPILTEMFKDRFKLLVNSNGATIFAQAPVEELAKRSDLIVLGIHYDTVFTKGETLYTEGTESPDDYESHGYDDWGWSKPFKVGTTPLPPLTAQERLDLDRKFVSKSKGKPTDDMPDCPFCDAPGKKVRINFGYRNMPYICSICGEEFNDDDVEGANKVSPKCPTCGSKDTDYIWENTFECQECFTIFSNTGDFTPLVPQEPLTQEELNKLTDEEYWNYKDGSLAEKESIAEKVRARIAEEKRIKEATRKIREETEKAFRGVQIKEYRKKPKYKGLDDSAVLPKVKPKKPKAPPEPYIGGNLDNTIHMAIVAKAMHDLAEAGEWPVNVIVAFTNAEEVGMYGARSVVEWINTNKLVVRCAIVLDICNNEYSKSDIKTIFCNWYGGSDKHFRERLQKLVKNDKVAWSHGPRINESVVYSEAKIPAFNLTAPANPWPHIHSAKVTMPESHADQTYDILVNLLLTQEKWFK